MSTNTNAHDLNEWIRVLPQFHDPMNDYYPGTLWLDTDTGTYGDARTLVLIDVREWTWEDNDAWFHMSDAERGKYGELVKENRAMTTPNYVLPTPSQVSE